jgi:hypothetical protein
MGRLGGKLSALTIAVLLALFLVACGGDDDDSAATDPTGVAQSQDGDSSGGGDEEGKRKSGEDSSGSGGEGAGSDGSGARKHDDSGGGSAQFKTRGGDNSVQEFGEEASEPEFDQAAEAVHGFFDARVRGDWKAACSYLASDVTESLKQLTGNSKELADADCATTLETISEGAPQAAFVAAAEADVGSLRIEGDQAFVIYRGAKDAILAMPMKEEDGTWKVASLAGTPLN